MHPADGTNSQSRKRRVSGSGSVEWTDSELLRAIRGGEEAAFHELVDRHGDTLFALAYSLLGSRTDAEDAVQETFMGAFRRAASFEGRSSLKTWLVRILVNQAYKTRRSRKVRKTDPIELEDRQRSDGILRLPSGSVAVESRIDVQAMLKTLSPEHREVIVLRELQGFSYEEMAEALGVPVGTVESRLFRARKELKQRFTGYLD
jgi:RNA polymerase sigma-70 factor (ECF subfamily)